jgi:hypothetical protein
MTNSGWGAALAIEASDTEAPYLANIAESELHLT